MFFYNKYSWLLIMHDTWMVPVIHPFSFTEYIHILYYSNMAPSGRNYYNKKNSHLHFLCSLQIVLLSILMFIVFVIVLLLLITL